MRKDQMSVKNLSHKTIKQQSRLEKI